MYLNFCQQVMPQIYHNTRLGYELSYPYGWEIAAFGQSTSTTDTVYFFSDPESHWHGQYDLPPKSLNYISASVVANPQHLYPADWYQRQPDKPAVGEGETFVGLDTNVYDHEGYSAAIQENGKVVAEQYLVDDNGSLLILKLVPSPLDTRAIPLADFAQFKVSIIFDADVQNPQSIGASPLKQYLLTN
jgi:hypothetical protein